jgi:hypothetical protein
MYFDRS